MAQYINNNNEYYDGISVVIGDTRYVSPSEELILQAGYHKVEEPQTDPLEDAKQAKYADIDAEDASHEVFTLGGQQMWLGHELRQQLKTSVDAYIATGKTTVTKWFGGQEFTFPCETWLQMLAVLEVYAAETLNTTEAHKAAISALNSVEAVEEYDITSDYPESLVFTQQMLESLGK